MRRKNPSQDISRESILQSALKCFQAKGFKGTTMADIAKGLDVTPAALYLYFKSKKEIFDALERPELNFPSPRTREREEEILSAARKVFSEKGYTATTMDDVAEVVGITKSALYAYFAGKEQLFNAVIMNAPVVTYMDSFVNSLSDDGISIGEENKYEVLGEKLYKIALGYLEMFRDETMLNFFKITLAEGTRDPKVASSFREFAVSRGAALVGKYLEDAGLPQKVDLKGVVPLFFGMLASWVIINRVFTHPDPQSRQSGAEEEAVAKQAVGLFLHGVKDFFI